MSLQMDLNHLVLLLKVLEEVAELVVLMSM